MRYKKTEICQTCAKAKNVCQVSLLLLSCLMCLGGDCFEVEGVGKVLMLVLAGAKIVCMKQLRGGMKLTQFGCVAIRRACWTCNLVFPPKSEIQP